MNSEVKVGILFFLGLGLVLWLTMFTTQLGQTKGTYAVNFPRVSKLKEGDMVTFNGVRVGTITEVAPVLLAGAPVVQVSFSIQAERQKFVLVDEHTQFRIVQAVLGGSALDMASHSGKPIAPDLVRGHMGSDPAGFDEVLGSVKVVIDENRAEIKQAITTVRESMEKFGRASEQIEALVKENRAEVGKAITNFSEMSERIAKLVEENRQGIKDSIARFDEMSQQIRDLVKENRESVKSAAEKLPVAVQNVGDAAKSIQTTVDENRADIRKAIADIASFTPKLNKIGDNLEVITTQIASGKGTVGKLVFEDTLHDKAVQAVDSLNNRLEEVKPLTGGFSETKLWLGVAGGIDTNTKSSTYGAYLRYEPKPWKFYEGGVSYRTAPDERVVKSDDPNRFNVDFTLLLGWRFVPDDEAQIYHLSLAAGIIESQPGVTASWSFTDRLSLDVMARGKDNQRDQDDRRFEDGHVMLRAALSYRLWDRITISAGGNDLGVKPGGWVALSGELLDNDLRGITQATALGK
ncbi:MAG: MCE family protein [Planctomycetes bacterium]|nr:MCE family protein [Planctomycetota bacterium]